MARYFLLGSFATAFLAVAASPGFYGSTGSTNLGEIRSILISGGRSAQPYFGGHCRGRAHVRGDSPLKFPLRHSRSGRRMFIRVRPRP